MSKNAAIEPLVSNRRIQFDPSVVEALLSVTGTKLDEARWAHAPEPPSRPDDGATIEFVVSIPEDARGGQHLGGIAVWSPENSNLPVKWRAEADEGGYHR